MTEQGVDERQAEPESGAERAACPIDGAIELTSVELPDGCELVRTTREFDEHTVPAGLLAAHRVAAGVWGRLVVRSGSLRFGFDDAPDERLVVAGDSQVIPPARLHHLTIEGAVRFVVEFHRPTGAGTVST